MASRRGAGERPHRHVGRSDVHRERVASHNPSRLEYSALTQPPDPEVSRQTLPIEGSPHDPKGQTRLKCSIHRPDMWQCVKELAYVYYHGDRK